jgi:predicted lipoprotein with Yx(FWY)xxD motif
MKVKRALLIPVALTTLAMAGTALGQSAHASASRAVIKTTHSSLGTILVTGSGQTLYLNTGDKPGHFACTGGCLTVWPPLTTSGKPKSSGGAKAAELGTTKGPGGVTQVTYNKHPLYTFASASTGTSGEAVNGFFVVSPSGSKVTSKSSSGGSGSSPPAYR